MPFQSDPEYEKQVYQLYNSGEFARAYELLTQAAERYPEEMQQISKWRFDLAARLGKPELAESIFAQALDAGYFHSQRTLRTDDFDAVLPDITQFLQGG